MTHTLRLLSVMAHVQGWKAWIGVCILGGVWEGKIAESSTDRYGDES